MEYDPLIADVERTTDKVLDKQIKKFYNMLKISTAKGSYKETVLLFDDDEDGIRAWQKIYFLMEKKDSKETVETEGITDLISLELNKGYTNYVADYHKALREAGHDKVCESHRKVYFLNGIKDKRYQTTKDMCKNVDLEETMRLLRLKAIELKDLDGSSQITRHNNHNRKHNNTSTNNKKNNKKKWNGKTKNNHTKPIDNHDPNRAPASLFNKLDPKEKNFIINMQNKLKSSQKPGKQYDKSSNANAKKTVINNNDNNDDKDKKDARSCRWAVHLLGSWY
ncbi:MAG: hypothetical protein AAF587_44525 [Bacteroidota bacterium]